MTYELVPLRDDLIYTKQSRKKPAKSILKQYQCAAGDFETIGGYVYLFSLSWFDKKGEQFSSVIEYDIDHPFTIANFVEDIFSRSMTVWRGSGKRKGITCPYLWFYNLSYDASAIIKALGDSVINHILDFGEVVINADTHEIVEVEIVKHQYKLTSAQYKMKLASIKYLPKKHMEINPLGALKSVHCKKGYRRNRGKINMFDIAQFYRCSLNAAAKNYLGESKLDVDAAIAGEDSERGRKYRVEHRQELFDYALVDAELTARLAWLKVKEFQDQGVRMIMPYSGASVAQRNLLDTCTVPSLNQMWMNEREVVTAFWSAYVGGWFESLQSDMTKGKGVRCFDIVSAYPYVMYQLKNFDLDARYWCKGTFKNNHRFTDWLKRRRPYSAGVCEARVVFPEGLPIYPAAKMSKKGCVINPRSIKGWFTADEITEFQKWDADIRIRRWMYHVEVNDVEADYPLRPFIDRWYRMKDEEGKLKGTTQFDKARYGVSKQNISSIYGKLLQTQRKQTEGYEIDEEAESFAEALLNEDDGDGIAFKTSKLFNPIWGAIITGATRCRMAEMMRLNGLDNIIQVATDGIIMKNHENVIIPEKPLPAILNLGDWEEETNADGRTSPVQALIMMSGVYSLIGANGEVKSKQRGSASLFIGRGDQPKSWLDFCTLNADDSSFTRDEHNHPHSRPFTLGEARIRGDYSLVNVFRPVKASISSCGDSNKRRWEHKRN